MLDTTGVEPDGYNETIVPHDSRTLGIYDIPDKTLAALLARLSQKKGKNITVILDSCHSGSGTRKMEPGIARARLAPIDNRLPLPIWITNYLAVFPQGVQDPAAGPQRVYLMCCWQDAVTGNYRTSTGAKAKVNEECGTVH